MATWLALSFMAVSAAVWSVPTWVIAAVTALISLFRLASSLPDGMLAVVGLVEVAEVVETPPLCAVDCDMVVLDDGRTRKMTAMTTTPPARAGAAAMVRSNVKADVS